MPATTEIYTYRHTLSPPDALPFSAPGTTGVTVLNAGGTGAVTRQNGILVVEAVGGATTASAAFALNHRVAVGAYEYFLFRGGTTAGTGENWYLRSTLPPAPEPTPEPETPPPPTQIGRASCRERVCQYV